MTLDGRNIQTEDKEDSLEEQAKAAIRGNRANGKKGVKKVTVTNVEHVIDEK